MTQTAAPAKSHAVRRSHLPLMFAVAPRSGAVVLTATRCGHPIAAQEDITLNGNPISEVSVGRFFTAAQQECGAIDEQCTACVYADVFPTWIVCARCQAIIEPNSAVYLHEYDPDANISGLATQLANSHSELWCMQCDPREGWNATHVWNGEAVTMVETA